MSISPEEKETLLQHEAFIKEVLALREDKAKDSRPKPAWQRFLESTGGTALVTVLIGGIMGSIITGLVQRGAKEREAQQSRLTTRSNQAQIAYKEYLDKELEIVDRTFDLVGNCVSASEDVAVMLTTPVYDPNTYKDEKTKKDLDKQLTDARERYNKVNEKWSAEQYKLGLLMTYYHYGSPEVEKSWKVLQDAVTEQLKCTNNLYSAKVNKEPTDQYKKCEDEKKKVIEGLNQLNKSLEQARHHFWENEEASNNAR